MSAHTPIDDDLDGSSAPLIEHLKELRTRIIWSVLALVVAWNFDRKHANDLQPTAESDDSAK